MISNLKHYVQPSYIQNRIYILDQKTGTPKCTSSRHPFGKYATSENFTDSDSGIAGYPSLCLSSPRNIFEGMNDQQKDVTNAVKTFCNKRPCCFFCHHGGDDSACRFHGLHIHIVAYSETKLCDVYAYKVLKKVCAKYELDLKCQKIKHLEALLHHLQEEPRFLLSSNNLSLCARLKKTRGPNPFYAGLELTDFNADENNEVVQRMDDGGTFVCDILRYKEQRAPPKMSEVIDRLAKQN